jgi:hypothetical protein
MSGALQTLSEGEYFGINSILTTETGTAERW